MGKPQILIADDDPDDRMLILDAFSKLGYADQIKLMNGGLPLVDYLSHSEADSVKLIVLDMNMPMMNGVETLKILKSDSRHRQVPVVIFSTSVSEQDKKTCQELGADEFIVKPTRYLDYIEICEKFYAISQNA